jgi:hypothetical protein
MISEYGCTKKIQKVRAILEYFRCMIGNTAEAWPCCSSRSDGDMLRVWFSCSPFVPSEHGVNDDCSTRGLHQGQANAVLRILMYEGIKRTEIHPQLAAKYVQNFLPQYLKIGHNYVLTTFFNSSFTIILSSDATKRRVENVKQLTNQRTNILSSTHGGITDI